MPFGWPELIIVLVIVLLVFGPKRLPMLGKQLGGGMREFKDSITRKGGDADEDADDAGESGADAPAPAPAELTRAQQADVLDPTPDATKAPTGARDESATRSGS
ncbi:twin-arginine translocase TatA/TatE family subunit [Baekduia sp.]|uniref:Sec-independent protein translocase subunit TatA/TatB n=1 Tax=Baekduia sp. TaxID=2600305 RepID=UPI0032C21E87